MKSGALRRARLHKNLEKSLCSKLRSRDFGIVLATYKRWGLLSATDRGHAPYSGSITSPIVTAQKVVARLRADKLSAPAAPVLSCPPSPSPSPDKSPGLRGPGLIFEILRLSPQSAIDALLLPPSPKALGFRISAPSSTRLVIYPG